LVAARKRARGILAPGDETDILEQALGFLADLMLLVDAAENADLERSVAARESGRHDVLEHRQLWKYLRGLKDARDAKLVDLARRLAGQHGAVEYDCATGRGYPADDDVQQRRLSGTVRADDGMGLPFLDLEVDI